VTDLYRKRKDSEESHPVDLKSIYWPAQMPKTFRARTQDVSGSVVTKEVAEKEVHVSPLLWPATWRLLTEMGYVRTPSILCTVLMHSIYRHLSPISNLFYRAVLRAVSHACPVVWEGV